MAAGVAAPEAALSEFIQRQRWFAGRDRGVATLEIEEAGILAGADPALLEVVVVVTYRDHGTERYHVPLSVRTEANAIFVGDHLVSEGVRDGEPVQVIDALADGEAASMFWRLVSEDGVVPMVAATIRGRTIGDRVAPADPSEVHPLAREQSNSLLLRGDTELLKCFRRIETESSPELEMLEGLAGAGFTHIARPLGVVEYAVEERAAMLAMLQPYLHNATEGWALAQTSLRDLYAEAEQRAYDTSLDIRALVDDQGSDFSPEAERLGVVTAEMHLALASAQLPDEMRAMTADSATVAAWAAEMTADLESVLPPMRERLPELGAREPRIRARLLAMAELTNGGLATRVHGDFHLGQVVRTDAGWTVLDFEGEPTRTVAARRRRSSPLRDVAGMLRSFDYAAAAAISERTPEAGPERERLLPYADAWAGVNREAFWDAYVATAAGHGLLPGGDSARVLLEAFETQKALYEVDYELKHRPDWLWIPARFLERQD